MNNKNYNFDKKLNSDEYTKAFFAAIINTYKVNQIPNNGISIYITDMNKVADIMNMYKVLNQLTKNNKDIKVTYELNKPTHSMGSITISGKCMNFKNQTQFLRVIEIADNFEIYPKIDGTVEMNFTFHNITQNVGI